MDGCHGCIPSGTSFAILANPATLPRGELLVVVVVVVVVMVVWLLVMAS